MSVASRVKLALVVESDKVTIQIVGQALRSAGYRVKTADGINKALALAEDDSPDIVFSEMTLADGNGISLVFATRLRLPALQFVLMTRQPSAESSIEAMRSGVNDILLKPLTGSAVVAALARISKFERRVHDPSIEVALPAIIPNDNCVSVAFNEGLKRINSTVVHAALRHYKGNKSATARALDIPRRSLYRLLGEK